MLELIPLVAIMVVGMLCIGFLTPKFLIWGSLTTFILWMTSHLINSFTPEEVTSTLVPMLYRILFLLPEGLGVVQTHASGYGVEGLVAMAIIGLMMVIPYLVGVFFGLTNWIIELAVFRLVFGILLPI